MSRSKQRPVPSPPLEQADLRVPRLRRGMAWAGLIVLVAALGVLLAVAWRRHEAVARVQAGLPVTPDSKTLPAMFADRLAAATSKAKNPATALEGAADLGRLYHASGFPGEAETCWQLLRAAQPKEARWCYYLAELRRVASDYAGLAGLLARTTELAPNYSPAWLQLADLLFKTGNIADAEQAYQRRLALAPGDPYARLGLARVALQQGRRGPARELIELLVKETPEFSPGHNLYAEMLAADGDAKKADQQRWL